MDATRTGSPVGPAVPGRGPRARRPGAVLVLVLAGGLLAPAAALAQAPTPAETPEPAASAEGPEPSAWGEGVVLFPGTDGYGPYVADPHRPTNAATVQLVTDPAIDGARRLRTWLAAGGRFGLLRLGPRKPGGRCWQVGVEAGLDAVFDSESRMANVGWDGNYGLVLTSSSAGPLALKLAALHVSGHLGDEWMDETGRRRIGYTREEAVLGLAVRLARPLRLYAEGGWAYHSLNRDLQKPWRAQGGLEAQWPRAWGRVGPYLAADLQSFDERDWCLDWAVETGVVAFTGDRRWRLGVRYVVGRPPLAEFFRDDERWLTFGLGLDL